MKKEIRKLGKRRKRKNYKEVWNGIRKYIGKERRKNIYLGR